MLQVNSKSNNDIIGRGQNMDPGSMDPPFGPGPWTTYMDPVHGPGPWTPYLLT